MDDLKTILIEGGALVLPTETVYGLFADALSEEAVNRVYALKHRPRDKAMNLNVASLDAIYRFSKDQPDFLPELYQAFLPGPLTIILKANDQVPDWVNSGLETVGFRVPSHPITHELILASGPLIGPSANISGQASGTSFKDIMRQFSESVQGVSDDAYLTGQDSTILDLSSDTAKILRQGAISQEQLQKALPHIRF